MNPCAVKRESSSVVLWYKPKRTILRTQSTNLHSARQNAFKCTKMVDESEISCCWWWGPPPRQVDTQRWCLIVLHCRAFLYSYWHKLIYYFGSLQVQRQTKLETRLVTSAVTRHHNYLTELIYVLFVTNAVVVVVFVVCAVFACFFIHISWKDCVYKSLWCA